MEEYKIIYHPLVETRDIPKLGSASGVIKNAIEKKLVLRPEVYGRRLRGTLKGYWKLRVVDWRVVYEIHEREVAILAIIHRSDNYKTVTKRLD